MRTRRSLRGNSEVLLAFKASRPALGGQISAKMIGKIVGQKYVTIAKAWFPTMAGWGSTAGIAIVYVTDW
uniref:Uncharacterized protein n=1 Tax=Stegastes partitus TaxID=144197 RepID=A0A3B4ZGU0_9TELE